MLLSPDRVSFFERYEKQQAQLVSLTLPSDLETPVAAMLKLKHLSPHHFLFESVEGGAVRGRYSFIGLDPDLIWTCQDGKAYIDGRAEPLPPLDSLRILMRRSHIDIPAELPPMSAGIFGYLGYDMVRLMEHLPDVKADTLAIPDSIFVRPRIIVVFDSVKDSAIVVTPVWYNAAVSAETAYQNAEERLFTVVRQLATPAENYNYLAVESEQQVNFTSNMSREEYHAMVEKAKEYIRAGDIFQVVPGQRFTADFDVPAFAFYRSLRRMNPSPFLFYLTLGDFSLVGSSPEILVRMRDGKVTNRPLAGTRKRGANEAEDKALTAELLADQKDRAEHLMLVDLGRNDVGRVAKQGTVKVTEMMTVEYYSHVMHISSNVEGELAEGLDAIDALVAAFPVGTVSGAPKIRAMEIIDELEKEKRSFYAGGVGYISATGNMDTCIALRTALVKGGKIYVQAGGGVVADSDPEAEYQESCNKAKALMKAAEKAVQFT